MSKSSQDLSGRSSAKANRQARMAGKAVGTSMARTAIAPKPKAESLPVSRSNRVPSSVTNPAVRRTVAPMASTVILAEGREFAKAKRKQAMSGKSNSTPARPQRVARKPASTGTVATIKVSSPTIQPVTKPTARRTVAPAASTVILAEGRESAKAKRKQAMRGKTNSGYGQSKLASQKPTRVKKDKPEAIIEPRSKSASAPIPARVSLKVKDDNRRSQLKNTAIADSSGRNMSKAWRKALLKGKTGEAIYKSKNGLIGTVAKITNPDASTRDIARSVREQRCAKGKSCSPVAAAPKRQERKKSNAGVEKVAFSSTLSGQSVSGVQVGQGQITGAEGGACQLVSGTEYLSMEEFSTHCSSTPQASPAKVTTTQTTKGQTISGNKIGQSKVVTGDRNGQCSAVTGTNYLPADQGQMFCDTDAQATKSSAASFSLKTLTPTQRKTEGHVISGGSAYPDQSGSIFSADKAGYEVPQKVLLSNTFAGNPTTGTQVGSPRAVTGDDKGKCLMLTGTGYQGKEEVEQICQTPVSNDQPKKVNISGTFSGQAVTGDRSGANGGKVTGGEAGRCKSVSGTAYMGSETIANCTTQEQQDIVKKFEPMARQHGHPLTGVQPGPQGLTGAQKGACELVSGTNYQGSDQVNMLCGSSQAAVPGESDYPVMVNAIAPVGMLQQTIEPVMVTEPASGAELITGDGWDRGSKVTGTEGEWAAQRNPSRKGSSSVQTPMSAASFRPNAMPEVPQSPITGSSGNTETGAKVTLSGGARA